MSKDKTRKKFKAESDAVDTLLRDLMAKPDGRLLIWWLLSITNYGQQPFTSNALTTAFNCGVLDVGQRILARVLSIAPEGYIKLLEERKNGPGNDSGRYDYTDPRGVVDSDTSDDGNDN